MIRLSPLLPWVSLRHSGLIFAFFCLISFYIWLLNYWILLKARHFRSNSWIDRVPYFSNFTKAFGPRIKIMWEKQLVDHPIHLLKKTHKVALSYVNLSKKTMRKTLITYLNPTYLRCFSPAPKKCLKCQYLFVCVLIYFLFIFHFVMWKINEE